MTEGSNEDFDHSSHIFMCGNRSVNFGVKKSNQFKMEPTLCSDSIPNWVGADQDDPTEQEQFDRISGILSQLIQEANDAIQSTSSTLSNPNAPNDSYDTRDEDDNNDNVMYGV
ncbi:hypothetical protein BC941DRAFT_454124 [Chlamydoabsidia padenii]|nr:hypothetical protein BC941DRAFT_454124 [Chlamydoabsidia padenii]